MSFVSHKFECPKCEYSEDRLVERGEVEIVRCPNCGDADLEKAIGMPSIGGGKDSNPHQHQRMVQSFRERFVKKELTDLRHKHGKAIDDSLAGAALARIKKGKI